MDDDRTRREEIALIEKRLDLRRQRAAQHWQEARRGMQRTATWLPMVGIAGILLAGYAWGHRRRSVPSAIATRTGRLATLIAAGGAGLRIALSPQGRALWASLRAAKTRSPY